MFSPNVTLIPASMEWCIHPATAHLKHTTVKTFCLPIISMTQTIERIDDWIDEDPVLCSLYIGSFSQTPLEANCDWGPVTEDQILWPSVNEALVTVPWVHTHTHTPIHMHTNTPSYFSIIHHFPSVLWPIRYQEIIYLSPTFPRMVKVLYVVVIRIAISC